MKRALLILTGILVVLLLLRVLRDEIPSPGSDDPSPVSAKPGSDPSGSDDHPGASGAPAPGGETGAIPPPFTRPDPLVGRTPDGKPVINQSVELSRQLHNLDEGGDEDVAIIDQVFWFYRRAYGENPVASQNSDVIAALTGDNPRKMVFFDPNHPSIDGEGRLIDRWGTPYQFHALSETKLDVWSAGPDRKFGTLDDVQLGLEEAGLQLQAEE